MEKTLKEKQLEVLNSTIKYFNINNRSTTNSEGGSCWYHPQYGGTEGCAIGRLVKDKALCKKLDTLGSIGAGHAFLYLPHYLKDLTKEFLTEIQDLHDSSTNWNKSGLSERGRIALEKIKIKFNLR